MNPPSSGTPVWSSSQPHCHFTTQPPPTRATHLSSSIHRESRPAGGLLMPSALRWRPCHVLFSLRALCFVPCAVPVSCCRATLSSMGPSTMQLEVTANRERPNDVIEHGSNDWKNTTIVVVTWVRRYLAWVPGHMYLDTRRRRCTDRPHLSPPTKRKKHHHQHSLEP
jgi:hypothetical protein